VQRIGILGGTFNPPHIGHIALARHARSELGLERVLLMPAYIAPHKPTVADDPGPIHRLQMCRLAVADEPGLETSALEIERGGTSYTVDTVQAIHDAHPDAWREPARLLGMVRRLAVAQRDEQNSHDAGLELASLAPAPGLGATPCVTPLRMAPVAASSSAVRHLIAAGEPVTELVGETVAGYIAEHGLYRTADASPAATGGAA
jgi:nicotinate-nucleotide adenylyltransferase